MASCTILLTILCLKIAIISYFAIARIFSFGGFISAVNAVQPAKICLPPRGIAMAAGNSDFLRF
jgi:lipopolysaccharide export LptBFGC system permease protein LptF